MSSYQPRPNQAMQRTDGRFAASQTVTSAQDSLITALAAYAQVLNDALERETFHENRMHYLGHLAMAARMFTYLHLTRSNISLEQIHRIETSSHAGRLRGDTAKAVRDAWSKFEPILRRYIETERDASV